MDAKIMESTGLPQGSPNTSNDTTGVICKFCAAIIAH